jgi:hypothetical protein
MNTEIVKAINKKKKEKEKKHTIRNWWRKNDYKVIRVILFPLWVASIIKEKIGKWLDSRNAWSEERANEILNYYIPRRADWDNEDKTFYFFDNGYGWDMCRAKKYLKRKDRRFWKLYGTTWGKVRRYLIDEFELDGFTKKVGECSESWTEICFRMNET